MSTVNRFRKAWATDNSAAAFVAKAPTTTLPASAGVLDIRSSGTFGMNQGNNVSKYVQIMPFGIAANNKTFDLRLWGWTRTLDNIAGATTPYWIPQLLIEVNVVCGNIAAGFQANTFFADTLVVAKGDADSPIVTPANDLPAHILVHLRGCEMIEFDFDSDAGGDGGTGANALWRLMDQ